MRAGTTCTSPGWSAPPGCWPHGARTCRGVVFMFQPGEEGQGGAQLMIDEGVLDAAGERVVAAYGLHVISTGCRRTVAAGRAGHGCRLGLGGVDGARAGGHGSSPHSAADPVPAWRAGSCRAPDGGDPADRRLRPGRRHRRTDRGRHRRNVIPETARFAATVRTFSRGGSDARVRAAFERTVLACGGRPRPDRDRGYEQYPPTVNDADEAAGRPGGARQLLGEQASSRRRSRWRGPRTSPTCCREVPGAFVCLGRLPARA